MARIKFLTSRATPSFSRYTVSYVHCSLADEYVILGVAQWLVSPAT